MSSNDHSLATVAGKLASALGRHVAPQPGPSVHGGCINNSYRWESADGPLFVKLADPGALAMFEAEAAGLNELAGAKSVRVPRVLAVGSVASHAFLALEWIDLAPASGKAQALLGEQLARQHGVTSSRFGWSRDNTIGSTGQVNAWTDDWLTFWREHRLRFQLELARRNGHGGRLYERGSELLQRLNAFFTSHSPKASLLHGDLWGGNTGADAKGTPVIFDPAVYFGDRETDLAMTRLFGGFSASFYSAYESAWPLPPGAAERVDLYNLYHVLNHLNLFGASYLRQAQSIIDRLLAQVGH
jgi:protein-ribulosamine 3-kinase